MGRCKGKHRLYSFKPGVLFFDNTGWLYQVISQHNWIPVDKVDRVIELGPFWGKK